MTMRDIIRTQYPVLDHTESVANIVIDTLEINPKNGVTIIDAFSCEHNALFFVINNKGNEIGLLTIKSGNAYPNSMLGDIEIELSKGISVIFLQDLARFQKEDESLDLDFNEEFKGDIYAVAKWAGVK